MTAPQPNHCPKCGLPWATSGLTITRCFCGWGQSTPKAKPPHLRLVDPPDAKR